jgi:hypothetical protein
VKEWPNQNNGQRFQNLEPQAPQGRIIDMIYYQKRPQNRNETSPFGECAVDTVNSGEEYIWVDPEVRNILSSHIEGRDLNENDVLRILLGLGRLPAAKEPVDPSPTDLETRQLTLPEYHEMLKTVKKEVPQGLVEWATYKPKTLIMPDGTNHAIKTFDGPGIPGYPNEGWPVIPYIVFWHLCAKGKIRAGKAELGNILISTDLHAILKANLSSNKYFELPGRAKTKVYMTGKHGGPVGQTDNAISLLRYVDENPGDCLVTLT